MDLQQLGWLASGVSEEKTREKQMHNLNQQALRHCTHVGITLSTGHIPAHTAQALGSTLEEAKASELWEPLSYAPFESGWYFWICTVEDEKVREAHPELIELLKLARANGAERLVLDSDGDQIVGLPSFEW